MKKILLILFCLPIIGFGQVLTPSLVSSSGSTFNNSNVIIDFSIGEIVINTFNSSSLLTQGFHQEVLKITTELVNIDIKTKVYPNPTTSILNIELERNIIADIMVYDINGKLVIKDKLKDEQKKQLEFDFLKQGNYILHINTADKKSIYQINKSR